MEITLETRNGITPNPTVEFLELCQLAVKVCTENTINAIVELQVKFKDLCCPACYASMKQLSYYGENVINITYSVQGTHIRYEFATHEKTGDFSYELAPYIYQTTIGNE